MLVGSYGRQHLRRLQEAARGQVNVVGGSHSSALLGRRHAGGSLTVTHVAEQLSSGSGDSLCGSEEQGRVGRVSKDAARGGCERRVCRFKLLLGRLESLGSAWLAAAHVLGSGHHLCDLFSDRSCSVEEVGVALEGETAGCVEQGTDVHPEVASGGVDGAPRSQIVRCGSLDLRRQLGRVLLGSVACLEQLLLKLLTGQLGRCASLQSVLIHLENRTVGSGKAGHDNLLARRALGVAERLAAGAAGGSGARACGAACRGSYAVCGRHHAADRRDRLDVGNLVAKTSLHVGPVLALLEENVNVAANELGDGFSLRCDQGHVVILVVAKVQGERFGSGSPTTQVGERVLTDNLVGVVVNGEHCVTGDTELLLQRLLLAGNLALDVKGGDAVRLEFAAVLNVAKLGVDLGHADELLVLVDALTLDRGQRATLALRRGEHRVLLLLQEARAVDGRVKVARDNLQLQGSQLTSFTVRQRVVATGDGVDALSVDEVQLHRVRPVDVGVVHKKLLLEHDRLGVADTLFGQRQGLVQPVLLLLRL
mmetsp:Transcript_1669/g.5364  ORF Transcript_1669/g.5364 Transcript_1669/m.5364 type:complete len:537 (+) Transcript_1669:3912-5522(+)